MALFYEGSNLPMYQVKLARDAYYGSLTDVDPCALTTESVDRALVKAAPFLQLPWETPLLSELRELLGFTPDDRLSNAFIKFVDIRNARLLPKPVDPRREAILKAYKPYVYKPDKTLMDAILAALDEVK